MKTVILLLISNIFMTFAWYAHLKELSHKPWLIAALISWGIAFFEYMLQVPANRIGHQAYSAAELKTVVCPRRTARSTAAGPVRSIFALSAVMLVTAIIGTASPAIRHAPPLPTQAA